MGAISKRDALQLAADIKRANIGGAAIGARKSDLDSTARAAFAFLGGLDTILQSFVAQHAGFEVADAVAAAMSYQPTESDIAAHNARIVTLRVAPPHIGSPT